jgi:hypothetical protein
MLASLLVVTHNRAATNNSVKNWLRNSAAKSTSQNASRRIVGLAIREWTWRSSTSWQTGDDARGGESALPYFQAAKAMSTTGWDILTKLLSGRKRR